MRDLKIWYLYKLAVITTTFSLKGKMLENIKPASLAHTKKLMCRHRLRWTQTRQFPIVWKIPWPCAWKKYFDMLQASTEIVFVVFYIKTLPINQFTSCNPHIVSIFCLKTELCMLTFTSSSANVLYRNIAQGEDKEM